MSMWKCNSRHIEHVYGIRSEYSPEKMSEDPSYGSFSQFGDSQDTQAIPPISSFAKRNARIASAGKSVNEWSLNLSYVSS